MRPIEVQLPLYLRSLLILSFILHALGCSGAIGDGDSSNTAPLAASSRHATFKTVVAGKFVVAENGGGGLVNANRDAAGAWETFTLTDLNGGDLTDGDSIQLAANNGQYVCAENGGGGVVNANRAAASDWETFVIHRIGGGVIHDGDQIALQTRVTGNYLSAINGGGDMVVADRTAVQAWETFAISLDGGTPPTMPPPPPPPPPGTPPDFGPNVMIFDPSMSATTIQNKISGIFNQQAANQFGAQRYAYLFRPGQYNLDVQVGFYMQVIGLGKSPDDVRITGAVRSKADWFQGNATQNFWRSIENLSIVPRQDGNVNVWAVSQATSFRRIHVLGSMVLSDGGWSSGGFIADSKFDVSINSGSQQQFFTRNSTLNNWQGGSWNMVFVGDDQAPGNTWPSTSYTNIAKTPIMREKPYLTIDSAGVYSVTVPALTSNSQGTTWLNGSAVGTALSINTFYIARADRDNASTLNAALAQGKNLLFAPGVYHLASTLNVTRAGTVLLGLGLPSLIPDNGNEAVTVADVDGVSISGFILEAGSRLSPNLLRLGDPGSSNRHASAPTGLFDLSCRVGGAQAGSVTTCITINSSDVLTDNLWMWRADHGDNNTNSVGWTINPSKNGIIVNGNNVTAYGLFVEHFQEYQTIWNGNGGRVYFYQSELPYDPPSQGQWQHGVNGWASYKVGDAVTTHEAWGLGVYCVFYNAVQETNAFETPSRSGVAMHHLITEWLGVSPQSAINHIINYSGGSSTQNNREAKTPY